MQQAGRHPPRKRVAGAGQKRKSGPERVGGTCVGIIGDGIEEKIREAMAPQV